MSDNTQQIVEEVKNELADQRFIGDKVLVSRRELVAVAAGSATVAGLLGHETGTASAQSGSGTGRLGDPTPLEYVGTDSVDADDLNSVVWVDENYGGNSELGAAFNQARADHPNQTNFAIKPGTYTVTTALDCTQTGLINLSLWGVTLNGETAGDPIIDFTGSRWVHTQGGLIDGQSTNTPSCAILLARDDSGSSVGNSAFFHTRTQGEYTAAALYNYAAEESTYISCRWSNDAGDGAYFGRDNRDSVTSPHSAMETGTTSANGFYFYGGKLRTAANDTTSAALHARGAASVSVHNSICMSDAGEVIHLDTAVPNVQDFELSGGRFHNAPGGTAAVGIRVDGANNLDYATIQDVSLLAANEVLNLASDTAIRGTFEYRPGKYLGGDAPIFDGDVCINAGSWATVYHTNPGPLTGMTIQFNGTVRGDLYFPSGDYSINFQSDGTRVFDGTSTENTFDGALRTGAQNGDKTVYLGPDGAKTAVENNGPVDYDEGGRKQPAVLQPTNLSGVSGDYIGQRQLDDGTNTSGGGLVCVWVDTDGDGVGDAWQPSDGAATFT